MTFSGYYSVGSADDPPEYDIEECLDHSPRPDEAIDYDEEDFYDGVRTGVGAATALQHMAESDIQLLV